MKKKKLINAPPGTAPLISITGQKMRRNNFNSGTCWIGLRKCCGRSPRCRFGQTLRRLGMGQRVRPPSLAAAPGVRPGGPGCGVTRTPDAPLSRAESARARVLNRLSAPDPQVLGPDAAVAVRAGDFGLRWCLPRHPFANLAPNQRAALPGSPERHPQPRQIRTRLPQPRPSVPFKAPTAERKN